MAADIGWPVDRHRDLGRVVAGVAIDPAHRSIPRSSPQIGVLACATPRWPRSVLVWIQDTFFADTFARHRVVTAAGPDPIILVVASAVWWLGTAVVIGLVGPRRGAGGRRHPTIRPGSDGRPSCRFWAGLVAVIGLATAVSSRVRCRRANTDGSSSRWSAILAMLILSGVLARAGIPARRDLVHLRGRARPDRRPDRLQRQLPVRGHRDRAVPRGRDPARRRVRGRPAPRASRPSRTDRPPAGPIPSVVVASRLAARARGRRRAAARCHRRLRG